MLVVDAIHVRGILVAELKCLQQRELGVQNNGVGETYVLRGYGVLGTKHTSDTVPTSRSKDAFKASDGHVCAAPLYNVVAM